LDKEYLENYEQEEYDEFERFSRRMRKDSFSLKEDMYPPDKRFVKLQKPVSMVASDITSHLDNVWAQVPFSGSLVLLLRPLPRITYEKQGFEISEIPELIRFVKETGRLQLALNARPSSYVGLDFLDPVFEELKPPFVQGAPDYIFGGKKELDTVWDTFLTLGRVRFFEVVGNECRNQGVSEKAITELIGKFLATYGVLKLCKYSIAEEIENQMVDDPEKAFSLLVVCRQFITDPLRNLRFDLQNFALEDVRGVEILPWVYRPREVRVPCEIGKFLLNKLTYAPQGLRACNAVIDEYSAYDLQKVAESLNDAIVTNHPDIAEKSSQELSEILDSVWGDRTIPRRIKGLQIGIPLSMAAVGSAAVGPIGAAGGFLAGLGYSVVDKFVDLGTAGLSERLAEMKTKSYQANIYDFKKKYKGRIANP
jgi:hypothetical protein